MNEANAIQFLSLLGVHNAELHGEWIRASCPLAFVRHKAGKDSKPSFGIHHEPTGRSGYHCFGCGIRGTALENLLVEIHYYMLHGTGPKMDLAKAYAMAEDENALGYHGSEWTGQIVQTKQKFEAWPEWWLESFFPALQSLPASEYLSSRNVPPAVSSALDLRYDSTRKVVGFPIRNRAGKLAGMRGRYLKPVGEFLHYDYKYNQISNTKLVWLGEHHTDFLKPVIVVEGQFDYAAVFNIYRNVIANLTASLSEPKVKKLETAVDVFGFFDDDEAGVIASTILKDRLKSTYRAIDWKPVQAAFKAGQKIDPAMCSQDQLRVLLKPYVALDAPLG